MMDYCTCGRRRIDETFLSGGIVYCIACRQPLCCDVVHLDPAVEPHPAEITDKDLFACWAHWNGIDATALSQSFSRQ